MIFLDPHSRVQVEKVARFVDELRPFEGERVADAEEAVADMVVHDVSEDDRRLRTELVRTVGSSSAPEPLPDLDPEDLRIALFSSVWNRGAATGLVGDDLFSGDRDGILSSLGSSFGISPAQIEGAMFADTPGERRLTFPAGERNEVARHAIRAVNLERLRRKLRQSVRLTLEMPARTGGSSSSVRLLWGAKRLGLMYDASESGNSILMNLAGPYALFGMTTMYGNRLFEFVRLVLESGESGWRLKADILVRERNRTKALRNISLEAAMRFHFIQSGHEPAQRPRSGDEEAFQKYFARCSRNWRLDYEGALVPLGEKGKRLFMVPDFVARCPLTPTEVLVEIVGFWKKEYLEKKIEKLRLLGNRHVAVIVSKKLSVAREDFVAPDTDLVHVFFYSGREELKRVAEMVAEVMHRIAGSAEAQSKV
jgi:predicted nuclease of restriction endonuclease-like RecB superfamily